MKCSLISNCSVIDKIGRKLEIAFSEQAFLEKFPIFSGEIPTPVLLSANQAIDDSLVVPNWLKVPLPTRCGSFANNQSLVDLRLPMDGNPFYAAMQKSTLVEDLLRLTDNNSNHGLVIGCSGKCCCSKYRSGFDENSIVRLW